MVHVRSIVVESSRRHSLGGVAVAVVRPNEQPAVVCLGLADPATDRPVASDTLFRIASISKTLTAIGLMQLRDQGRFQLDDAVNDHLKSLRIEAAPGGAEVTFRHLLTHTAGIGEVPRVTDLGRRAAWGMGRPGSPAADLAALYGGRLRGDVPAGSKWAYANHGFAVIGQLIEDIAGQPFAQHMRQHVLRPLGMINTSYMRTDLPANNMAVGYHWILSRLRPVKDFDLTLLGAGSVLSPLADMAAYTNWLLQGEARLQANVLRAETLAEMISPQFSVDSRIDGMGLGFFLGRLGGHRVAGHDGNYPGFASALLFAPDEAVGVVVLTNTSTLIGAHVMATSLLASQLRVPDPATQAWSLGTAERPDLWPELSGHYAPEPGFLTNFRSWQAIGGEAQVLIKNRHLLLRALSPIPQLRHGVELHPTDDNDPLLFAINTHGLHVPIAFRRDPSGRIATMCVGAAAMMTLHRRSGLRSSRRRLTAVAAGGLAAVIGRSAWHH